MEMFQKHKISCEDNRTDEVVILRKKLPWLFGIIIFFMAVMISYTVYIESLQDKRLNRLLRTYPELEAGIVDIYFKEDSNVYNDNKAVSESCDDNSNKYDIENETAISDVKDKYGYKGVKLITNKAIWSYLIGMVFLIFFAVLLKWKIEDRRMIKRQKRYDEIFNLLCFRLEYMKEISLISTIESAEGNVPVDYDMMRKAALMRAGTQSEIFCGAQRPVDVGSAPIGVEQRCPHGADRRRDILTNVFEVLKELENNMFLLKERYAEEENHTKSFITDISHQLKTPLASLKMSHELMQSENLTVKERKEFMEQESHEIEKLEQLLQELIKVSRLENHMIRIEPVEQSLKETIADAVSMVYGKAKGKRIQISVDMKNDYIVSHDRTWTAEAIENILDNAIKYSPADSFVEVRVKELASNILIEIEDQGIGIAKDEYHKIFKRFYRGRKASVHVKEGAGVGLYLARMIIDYQNGTISVKNNMGQGSVFQIMIPK
ncbi:MAG: HAMP domain-containing histidine kinase [Lachnospiraceae bacterium]|nr:HAMP domain-containing histidine kinase [Lachnospiraceae bacterium]